MTEDLNQIEQELKDLEFKIHQAAKTHRREARVAGRRKAAFEIANAKSLLNIYADEASSGDKLTEKVRGAKALALCEEEYLAYRISETEADSSREVLRAFQTEISSVQTRSRLLQTEAGLLGHKT